MVLRLLFIVSGVSGLSTAEAIAHRLFPFLSVFGGSAMSLYLVSASLLSMPRRFSQDCIRLICDSLSGASFCVLGVGVFFCGILIA